MRLTASTRARTAIVFAAISLFSACDDGPTGRDKTPPRLITTSPRADQTGVLPPATITVTFNEKISSESVGASGLIITGPGGTPVAGALTVVNAVIAFTPTTPLAYNTQYTGTVAPGVEDLLGNRQSSGHTWTFTTGPNPPPTVTANVPAAAATGSSRTAAISVTFSEPIAPASVTNTTFTVTHANGTPATGTIAVNGNIITFTPSPALAPGIVYTIRATTGITDIDGAALAADFTSTFTTTSNTLPVANAGSAQDVARLVNVTLAGSATDPQGLPITSYRWVQTAGPDVTGGVGFLTGQNPSFLAPANVSSVRFELRVTNSAGTQSAAAPVTIFVLEDPTAGRSIYVAANGNDLNTGVRAAPLRTITAAVTRAVAAGGGTDIYVAAGTYDGTVTLASGVSIYGGYTQTTFLRDTDANASIIQGGTSGIAVQGTNVANLSIDGLRINTAATTTATTGESRYGILLTGSQNVRISNNRITAAAGLAGAPGSGGIAGTAGLVGVNGAAAACTTTPTGGAGGAGGQPGTAAQGSQVGVAGGAGGAGGNDNAAGATGAAGAGAAPGTAGTGGSVGVPGENGGTGGNGTNGTNGTGGAAFGAVTATGYSPAGAAGTSGTTGTAGSSGGGAGGGGGAAGGAGGGGGGGGASGGAGTLGVGGSGGGGSFAIALLNSSTIIIDRNTLTTGAGGAGGAGGTGGAGGAGGAGGTGGAGCNGGANGGTGGAGGTGGSGGHGGGGGGGPSIGILEDAASTSSQTNNTFTIGAGGAGGASSGAAGATGVSSNTRKGA